ncbi:response regulator [Mitsuokella multacida]|uniref:response regulator n=1 Tax=Mitsuokella multacida TaxID=52226 RepID=UPI00265F879B|nr:response regulator [Mitsuokella multacida]
MLHIAICDDQPDQIRSIRQSSERYFQDKQDTVSYETFDNAFSFVDTINQGAIFDIVLLDVCMPGILGTEVARRWHKNCASSAAARRSSS